MAPVDNSKIYGILSIISYKRTVDATRIEGLLSIFTVR